MNTKVDTAARLALERGEFARYLDPYIERRVTDPVVACELATYLNRLDESRYWLGDAPAGPERDLAEAELLIAEGEYDRAWALLVPRRSLRDRLNVARIAYFAAEWLEVLGWAKLALAEAEASENPYLEGRAMHLAGAALDEMDERAEATGYLTCAVERLRRTENCRYRRLAECALAGTMLGTERESEGMQLIARAHDEALQMGHAADVRTFRSALTAAEYGAGRYERALALAAGTLSDARRDSDALNERYALEAMTRCYLAEGRLEDARDAMDSLALLDAIVRDADLPLSEALEWRLAGREGKPEAVGELLARAAGAAGWRATAFRVWAWDVIADLDPLLAWERRGELLGGAAGHASAYVRGELLAVEQAPRVFRITREDELVVSLAGRFPRASEVARLLEAYEFRLAWQRTAGNATRMAPLLGASRRSVSRKLARYRLEPRRRGRPASTPDERTEPVEGVEE